MEVFSMDLLFLLNLKMLDPVHNQGVRLCLGAFRTSPNESFMLRLMSLLFIIDVESYLYNFVLLLCLTLIIL